MRTAVRECREETIQWGNGTFAHSFTDKDPGHDPDGDSSSIFLSKES